MPKKILLVEDDLHILKLIQTRLEASGYEVMVAHDGLEGLKKVKLDLPDLVLTDIKMPQMDGIKMVRAIRKFDKGLPVVFLTAFPEEYAIKDIKSLKAAGYIVKGRDFVKQMDVIKLAIEITHRFKKE